MAIIERHVSPDGVLQLIVDRDLDGELLIALDGFAWHTHGDLLQAIYEGTAEESTRAFVDEVVASRWAIVILRIGSEMRDAWITSDPKYDWRSNRPPNERIEIRLWDGRPADDLPRR